MNFSFQPDPVVLFFLFAKKFIYLEVLAVLALIRIFAGRGLSRYPAAVAFLLAMAGVATVLAPAAGLNQGVLYASAAQTMAQGAGLPALLIPTAVFWVSAFVPGVRWRWIDALHACLTAGLLGLWWWTS